MTESKHTPGPWKVIGGTCIFAGADDETRLLAHTEEADEFEVVGFWETRANAAFIVRACNVHDELLEALQAILDDYFAWLESDYTPAFTERFLESQLYKQVSSALAKARGEQ